MAWQMSLKTTSDHQQNENELRLVFTGRLSRVKGVDVLLQALARIKETVPGKIDVSLDAMGTGTLEEELQELAGQLGIGDRVRFLGYLPDAATRLAQYDVFCLPSREDMCPLVCVEAMSQALPVVATTVGGLPELVVEGETGLLVPADDVQALATALLALAENPVWRRQMGDAGRRRFEECFTQEHMARQTWEIYAKASASRKDREISCI